MFEPQVHAMTPENMVIMKAVFAVCLCILIRLLTRRIGHQCTSDIVVRAVAAGLLFGLIVREVYQIAQIIKTGVSIL